MIWIGNRIVAGTQVTPGSFLEHRVLWLGDENDEYMIIDAVDYGFLHYVSDLRGWTATPIVLPILPSNNYESGTFLSSQFRALWPFVGDIPYVSDFTNLDGVRCAEFEFVDMLNSKVNGRRLAIESGLQVPPGQIVSSLSEVYEAAVQIFSRTGNVVLKKDRSHSASGIELVTHHDLSRGTLGAKFKTTVNSESQLREHISNRWHWLTEDGSRECLIEEFVHQGVTEYIESFSSDGLYTGHGSLYYDHGRLSKEWSEPHLPQDCRITDASQRFIDAYRKLGYLGCCSADAIVTPSGPLFTEMNARVSMSTHLYVGIRALSGDPNIKVVQFKAPTNIPFRSTDELIRYLDDRGLLFGGKKSGHLGPIVIPVPVAVGLNDSHPLLAAFVDSELALEEIFHVLQDS